MKMFLLSDNPDALLGMRLAGVKGRYIEDIQLFPDVLSESIRDNEIGILLITQKLSDEFENIINPLKMNDRPLIVSMPE